MTRLLAALMLLAISFPGSTAHAHSLSELESQLMGKEAYMEVADRPAPGFELSDAEGNPVGLGDLRGKVVVLNFVYASCTDVCPLHSQVIAQVQDMVNATPMRDQVRFVTITTDPVNDTDSVMAGYGEAHGLTDDNWTFLTSGKDRPDATRKLAQAFGHSFTPGKDGYQTHGIVTHVIDQAGVLRANFHGLKFDPTNLLVYVNALVNDPHEAPHTGSGH